jgi:hypothetical protein
MIKITQHCNRAYKKFSAVGSWENSNKASVEAQLKKIEVINSIGLLTFIIGVCCSLI